MQSQLHNLLTDPEDREDQMMSKFFVAESIIGQGAFSTVIQAFDQLSQTQVAIKILNKRGFKASQLEMLRKESEILNVMNHPNIVRLKMSKETCSKLFLVMELIKGVSLQEYINQRNQLGQPLKESEIKNITIQIVRAIKYFHEKDIIHRDLKPENIIIAEETSEMEPLSERRKKVKIIDFGLSAQLEASKYQPLNENCGTLLYMAPEVALKKEYNRCVDIWSLGIIVFYMFTMGQHPFWKSGTDSKQTYLEKMKNLQWSFWPENMSKQVCNFVTKTVARRSEYRMTAQQCLRHPWLLGEGEISDPITMGDMILNFSNMQTLSKVVKATFLLRYLVHKLDSEGALNQQKNFTSWQSTQGDFDLEQPGAGSGRRIDSLENISSISNINRLHSNPSISEEDSFRKRRSPQIPKKNPKGRMKLNLNLMDEKNDSNINQKCDQSNSLGQITRQHQFKLNLTNTRYMRSTDDLNEKQVQSTDLPDIFTSSPNKQKFRRSQPTLQSLNITPTITSKTLQRAEVTQIQRTLYQSVIVPGIHIQNQQISQEYSVMNSKKQTPEKHQSPPKQRTASTIKLPKITSKPPLIRNAMQYLQEASISQSSVNSPAGPSQKIINVIRQNLGQKSFFAKQMS